MNMPKKIIRRVHENADETALSSLHPLLQRIYHTRNVRSEQEIDHALNQLLPFHTLKDIDNAVSILAEAVMQDHCLVIVGDFDADGATSTTVAMRALRSFGMTRLHYLVPNRFAYGYGLTPEIVEDAKALAPKIIVTVDNGIANHAGVAAAKAAGMRVVITDHHLAAATLPDADAIVNPNQPGDLFPSKNLAGVGVIFYVMLALRRYLTDLNWFESQKLPNPNMSSLLDIVALGTVADLVQLDHNNRILIQHGLKRIRAGLCVPGIVALLELAKRDFSRVTASDLGFAVASRLNAAGRMDDMSLGIACLLTDDSYVARELAQQLNRLNDERRSVEQEMQQQALDALEKLTTTLQGELPRGLCLYDKTWHQGVIGILASRIKERFNRPVIVFAPGQDGEIKGSARSIAGLHIRDALACIDAQHPQLIKKFGGHAMAAGLTLAKETIQSFTHIFNEVISKQLTEEDLQHCLYSDGELGSEHMNVEVAMLIKNAGPWGQGFPEPIFDDVFEIVEQRIVGDKHLKLRLCKADKLIDAIAFFVDMNIWPNHRCASLHVAYRIDVNEYKGRQSVQLIVEHLQPL